MGVKIGLTYDLKEDYTLKENEPKDKYAEFDTNEVVEEIIQALVSGGHKVVRIGDGKNLLKRIKDEKFDIIFNIAEGFYGRGRESQVPAILEMLQIPYVGADSLTLGITLDKVATKKILSYHNIPTPRFMEVKNLSDLKDFYLSFPVIAKLRYEGSSKGMADEAFCRDLKQLKKRCKWLIATYRQPVLVEEFISGKEFTVGIIGNPDRTPSSYEEKSEIQAINQNSKCVLRGNGNARALPTVQIEIDGELNLGDKFYTHSRIESNNLKYVCPAKISDGLNRKIQNIALLTYKILECRDFGRVDFRLDKENQPYFLELNPLPSLTTKDIFPLVAKETGLSYNQVINKILEFALRRHGISENS